MRGHMRCPSRRVFIATLPGAALALASCAAAPNQPRYVGPAYKAVAFATRERPGTIVVDPPNHLPVALGPPTSVELAFRRSIELSTRPRPERNSPVGSDG